jgi:hypothetical protein
MAVVRERGEAGRLLDPNFGEFEFPSATVLGRFLDFLGRLTLYEPMRLAEIHALVPSDARLP